MIKIAGPAMVAGELQEAILKAQEDNLVIEIEETNEGERFTHAVRYFIVAPSDRSKRTEIYKVPSLLREFGRH